MLIATSTATVMVFIIVMCVAAYLFLRLVSESRKLIYEWCGEFNYVLLELKYTIPLFGRFSLITSNNLRPVFRVEVRRPDGQVARAWVRCSPILPGPKVEVLWDQSTVGGSKE